MNRKTIKEFWNYSLMLSLLAIAISLQGCSTAKPPPPATRNIDGSYKVGKPYQVAGVWYYPREQPDYDETGIASWYGPGFHGKATANGERYDQNDLTAAHQTLPMPVKVRVTNLDNGRSIIVRINDRGPFINGRIIDVSRRTAQLLGFDIKGTAPVRVQIVEGGGAGQGRTFVAARPVTSDEEKQQVAAAPPASVSSQILPGSVTEPGRKTAARKPPPVTPVESMPAVAPPTAGAVEFQPVPASRNMYVQAGAFRDRGNADRLRTRLESFVPGISVNPVIIDGQTFFRVRVGPMASVAAADAMLARVLARGLGGARIVID